MAWDGCYRREAVAVDRGEQRLSWVEIGPSAVPGFGQLITLEPTFSRHWPTKNMVRPSGRGDRHGHHLTARNSGVLVHAGQLQAEAAPVHVDQPQNGVSTRRAVSPTKGRRFECAPRDGVLGVRMQLLLCRGDGGSRHCLFLARQRELEDGAARLVCGGPNPSAVRLHDRTADR
jgi:hypothetical protein